MEIIKHPVMGIKELEFLSRCLYGAGIQYMVECDIFTTEELSIFNFTIKFNEDDMEKDQLEIFNKIFKK